MDLYEIKVLSLEESRRRGATPCFAEAQELANVRAQAQIWTITTESEEPFAGSEPGGAPRCFVVLPKHTKRSTCVSEHGSG
mmetsp:Transcript_17491/g.34172  ORF Transcript_17491/g.34172 Transcript_17491/m.34172 type:complete len:81 (+) Transcript_17491:73-315(+)